MAQPGTPLLIGIAGGTGSGKTTLAERIQSELGSSVTAIEHDGYYRDRSHVPSDQRGSLNYDEPSAIESDLLASHLNELRAGRAVDCPRYDCATHTRRQEHGAWSRLRSWWWRAFCSRSAGSFARRSTCGFSSIPTMTSG